MSTVFIWYLSCIHDIFHLIQVLKLTAFPLLFVVLESACICIFFPVWTTLSCADPVWTKLSCADPVWTTLSCADPTWIALSCADPAWTALSCADPECLHTVWYLELFQPAIEKTFLSGIWHNVVMFCKLRCSPTCTHCCRIYLQFHILKQFHILLWAVLSLNSSPV